MAIQLDQFHVVDVSLDGDAGADAAVMTGDGVLKVGEEALRSKLLARDARIAAVAIDVVRPGEPVRIAGVKDVVEPRCKLEGEERGKGRLGVLKNVAVATCGPIVGFQEGIIDMSGPGAEFTPFSGLPLLVLHIEPVSGIAPHAHEEAVRLAGLHAADLLARGACGGKPDATGIIDWQPLPPGQTLPRIAYVYMVLSQGLLHDTHVCGENARAGLPRLMDPATVIDNGIVSGNCVSACDKNTTYHHQNNPVISELLRGHGKTWDFAGIVLTNEPTRLAEKEASAGRAISLVRGLGAAAAVITKEGFGNPDADLMMLISGLERAGIKTVAITDEYAGAEGWSQSLADTTPEADAIVSTGNANMRVRLPAMERTIGMSGEVSRLAGAYANSVREKGELDVELQLIMGATNQLGFGRLRCREV